MTTAELFKEFVKTGMYVQGRYMCRVLDSIAAHFHAEKDIVIAHKAINNFMNTIFSSSSNYPLCNVIYDLAAHKYSIDKADKSENASEITAGIYELIDMGCLDIYSDWDNRFTIVDKLCKTLDQYVRDNAVYSV